MKILILVLLMPGSFQVVAETEKLFVGLGKIPLFADSFKPSVGYSKHCALVMLGKQGKGSKIRVSDDMRIGQYRW